MEIKKLEAAIEAVLFTMGESVELSQIAGAIQQDKETTRKIIHNMIEPLSGGGARDPDH